MKYTSTVREEVRKEATNIWLKIIEGVETALDSNEDVFYIRDMIIMGDIMTYMMKREDWLTNLEKARLYFEDLEEWHLCKRCRDLKLKISQIAAT